MTCKTLLPLDGFKNGKVFKRMGQVKFVKDSLQKI